MAAEQRYRVIQRLEAGGMAEVFKGEQASVQGFKKQVAIKRVLPHLAQNRNFIAMFLDEARLGARLNHANIVTVFDIGAADNTFFIVMEFVDGCNLKAIIEHYRQQGKRVGLKEATFITMEAAKGLAFAHDLTDDDGKLLNIVHRDVSPPNLLLSKRGEVKVTDFGLAKATTQLEKTDPGVVKGKFSYLSPEAALGQPVDARTDVFALGILLWEMLAGRRLFLGETDFQTVKLVQQAQVPSLSRINPEVDSELERILGKALEKDLSARFQTALEFQDALAGYLFSHKLKVTSQDLAKLVKSVVDAKSEAAKATRAAEPSIIDRLIQEELFRFTSLDDMSGPIGPSSPDQPGEGSKPLDAGLFENPADWFSQDSEVQGASPLKSVSDSGGWRESGVDDSVDLASELEGRASTGKHVLPARSNPPVAARTSQPGEARFSQPPAAPAANSKKVAPPADEDMPTPKSSNAALYVVLVLVLVGAGAAAAWFGGVIPH
jgi:serine/threonine protein kinase